MAGLGSIRRSWNSMSRRTRTIIMSVAGVLLLAAVILVVSALSTPESNPVEPVVSLTSAEQATDLYNQGLAALQSGDTTAAADLFQKALILDPKNTNAKDQLTKITQAGSSDSDSGGDTSADTGDNTNDNDTPPDPDDPDSGFEDPIADLASLLPKTLSGYKFGAPSVIAGTASVTADPTDATIKKTVRRVLFTVYDRGTAADAANFVTSVSKTAYPENGATVQVNGVSAYFGTNGSRFASVSYSRGRYAFETILTAEDGVAPSTLLDEVVRAASSFPTSP